MGELPRRPEFDALQAHLNDQFAHPAHEARMMLEIAGREVERLREWEARFERLEREWQTRAVERNRVVDLRLDQHSRDLSGLKKFMWAMGGAGAAITLVVGAFGAAVAAHVRFG